MLENQDFEYKKSIVIDTLVTLIGYWEMASPLINYIKKENPNENEIDALIDLIETTYEKIEDEDKSEKINKSMLLLKSLKERETEEWEAEIKNIDINSVY